MANKRAELAVSIINYQTGALTLQCLRSVLENFDEIQGQVVVVDNASGDGSAEEIQAWLDAQPTTLPVTLVRSESNTGFSGGHNQGIAAVDAEFYLLLNSDAVLRPGFCKTILAAAQKMPDVAFFAPRIEFDDGQVQTSCFRFHSPLSELIRSARTGLLTRALRHHDVSLGSVPKPDQIDWASFACILIRQTAIEELGPMDEGYFLYYEDAEYCLRARRAGFKIRQVPEAIAVHFRGGSGPVKSLAKARKRLPKYYYSSRTRFLYHAHGYVGLWAANLLWYLGRGVAHLKRLGGKRISPMPKAEGSAIWTNAFNPLGPRHAPHETKKT